MNYQISRKEKYLKKKQRFCRELIMLYAKNIKKYILL